MNEDLAAVVNCSPLKKSKKGMLPPKRPIKDKFIQFFLFNFLKSLNSLKNKIIAITKMLTKRFFANVNIEEFIPATPNLLMKIENPLTKAVKKTNKTPLFLSIFRFT